MFSMRKILYSLLIFVGFCFQLLAQKRSTFNNVENLDRYSTLSTSFEYLANKKDTVLDGTFSMESLIRSKGIDSSGIFEGFSMEYKKSKPEGRFTYTTMDFSPTAVSVFSDYHVTRRLNGLSWETEGQVKNGQPFQTWVTIGKKVRDSEVIERFGRYSVKYVNGALSGEFEITDSIQNLFINGVFGEANMFNGEIIFRGNQPFELHFEQGFLTRYVVEDQVFFSQELSDDLIPQSAITLDYQFENYLQTLKKIIRAKTRESEISFDYEEAVKKILYMVEAFEIVTGSKPIVKNLARVPIPSVQPKVQLPIYAIEEQEKKKYESFFQLSQAFVKSCDSMIAIPAFSLSAFNNIEVTRLFQKVKMIRGSAYRFNGLIAELNSEEFIHFDRMDYLQVKMNVLFSGKKENEFEFENEKYYIELNFPQYDSMKTALENAQAVLTFLEKELEKASSRVTEKMKNVKSEERLQNNEAQITKIVNSIDKILDDFETVLYDGITTRRLLDAIIAQKKNIVLTYTSSSKRQKISAGEEAIQCLGNLEKLLKGFPDLHEREKAIYEGYHENELNPVTWTRMETTLYERLFNAYQEKLIPYAVDLIESHQDLDCHRFPDVFNNILTIQNYMLKVAEENPGRVNRRLRNNDSVETILTKLNLELVK
jgi:hypothetical protein